MADKTYDGNTVATITGAASVTPLTGDVVFVGGGGTGSFADKNAGVGKSVVATGFVLTGADAANYRVAATSPSSASILPRLLTVGGLTAVDKIYDSNTVAQLAGTATLTNAITDDAIALSGSNIGSFADKNVGTAKPVTLSSFALVGTDARNYTLTQPAGLAAGAPSVAQVLHAHAGRLHAHAFGIFLHSTCQPQARTLGVPADHVLASSRRDTATHRETAVHQL